MYLFPPSTDCCDWIFSDVFEWAIISLECVAMASTTKHYLNKRKKENWFFTWNEPYIWKAGQHFLVQLFFFRWWCLSFRHDGHNGLWCGFRSWLGDLSSAGVICKMPNAECRMLCLLEASVTYICFRLAFSCWQGHLQYNAVINKQKLTATNISRWISQFPIFPWDHRCRSLSLTGTPFWSLDVSETGDSTKCLWNGDCEWG